MVRDHGYPTTRSQQPHGEVETIGQCAQFVVDRDAKCLEGSPSGVPAAPGPNRHGVGHDPSEMCRVLDGAGGNDGVGDSAGVALFAERPSALGWAGMLLSTAGVVAMSLARGASGPLWRRALPADAGSLLALAAALGIVIASFLAKDAVQAFRVANPDATGGLLEAVGHSVFHVAWIEVAVLTAAVALLGPAEFRKVPVHWRRMFWIGASGFAASMAWFWAFSIGRP